LIAGDTRRPALATHASSATHAGIGNTCRNSFFSLIVIGNTCHNSFLSFFIGELQAQAGIGTQPEILSLFVDPIDVLSLVVVACL